MDPEEQNIKKDKKQKKGAAGWLSWLAKLLFKVFAGILLFIIFISLSTYILFQFEGFRGWVSSQISSIASDQLEAKLEFEDIGINITEGIGLEKVSLITQGDTLAKIDDLYLTFQIRPFFDDHIMITNLVLEKPKVKFLRNKDSSWNYTHIAKPSQEEDTTTTKPSNWTIEIKNFELRDASFIMYDSTASSFKDSNYIDFGNLFLDRLNLQLSAKMETQMPEINVNIENLSFIEKRTFFNLRSFALDAQIDSNHAEINRLSVKTDKSEFALHAALDSINLFSGEDISEAIINLRLDGKMININDIYHFASIDHPLSEKSELELEIDGKVSEMNISKLDLKTGKTWLNLSGKLYNLNDPSNFLYDMSIKESGLYYDDLIKNLPKGTQNSVKDFGFAELRKIKVKGNDKFVESKLNIANKFGSISGSARLEFAGMMNFDADITTNNFNPGELMNDPALSGNINANIKAKGSGKDIDDLTGNFQLTAENSSFNEYNIKSLETKVRAEGKALFLLDTLYLELVKEKHGSFEDLFGDIKPYIASSGKIDLSKERPEYDLSMMIRNINTDDLFDNESLPQLFSSTIDINGKGFALDELEAEIHTSIQEAMFRDRGLMPIDIEIALRRDTGDYKELLVESELLSVFLNGDFSYNNFISLISMQGVYLEKFVENKINSFYQFSEADTLKTATKIDGFEPVNLSLEMKLYDLSPISPFLGDMEIYANASFDLDLNVEEKKSSFLINSINISSLQIKQPASSIIIRPANITGALFMTVEDSLPKLDRMSLNVSSDFNISLNDLTISEPYANVVYEDSTASFKVSSVLNDNIGFKTNGALVFKPDRFFTKMDTLVLAWKDIAKWRNIKPVLADINHNEYKLNQLTLQRDTAEVIDVSGSLKNDSLIKIDLIATDFPFSSVNEFFPDNKQEILADVTAELDTLDLHVKGSFSNPNIELKIRTNDIVIRKNSVGRFVSDFSHKNGIVTGFAGIRKSQYGRIKKLFEIDVRSLPLDLSLSNENEMLHSRYPIDVSAFADRFPVVLMEPFAAGVNDLKGIIDFNADISGRSYEEMEIEGKLKIHEKTSFVLTPTNIKYLINGNINFNQDNINIEKIELQNVYEDYSDGRALIKGDLDFDQFEFKNFDLSFVSGGIKVLSDASRKSLKSVYGSLIISTGESAVRLFGSLEKPNISGNLNVVRGNLTLPQTQSVREVESNVKYEIKGSTITVNAINKDLLDIDQRDIKEIESEEEKDDIINKLNIDIYASILGRFVITMDLGLLGQLYAEIGMADKTVPLHFVMERNRQKPQISGELKLQEGSRLNYLKLFKTTGTISFPTGEIENPELDLRAVYNGKTFIENETKDFNVYLFIKGTKERLDFRFDYSIDGTKAVGDSTEIAQDAILLLLTGKTTAQWRSGSGQQTNVVGGSLVSSAASPLLSQAATELLQGTVGIENAEIDLSTGWDNARMQLTGRLAGDVVWRFGGTIADFTQNNEITIDIPLPLVIHKDYLNNIILQLTQATNVSQTATRNQKKWEIKLKFGGSW